MRPSEKAQAGALRLNGDDRGDLMERDNAADLALGVASGLKQTGLAAPAVVLRSVLQKASTVAKLPSATTRTAPTPQ